MKVMIIALILGFSLPAFGSFLWGDPGISEVPADTHDVILTVGYMPVYAGDFEVLDPLTKAVAKQDLTERPSPGVALEAAFPVGIAIGISDNTRYLVATEPTSVHQAANYRHSDYGAAGLLLV